MFDPFLFWPTCTSHPLHWSHTRAQRLDFFLPSTASATVMSNILDPSAVSAALPNYLGTQKTLKSPQDALAALVHTILSVLGFRLVGIDESTTQGTFEGNVLPEGWNSHGPGTYTFRYRHEQSSLEFLVKLSKLGSRTIINAIAIEASL